MKTIGSIVKDSNRDLYTISADDTAYTAARYMTERNIGAVTIVDGTRVVGLFSERDLMKRVVASPGESYEEALRKMQQARVRHLPILEETKFIGLISLRDLLKVDADEKAEEIRFLNTYINYVPPGFASGA
jgi:CBS domain-containing protein